VVSYARFFNVSNNLAVKLDLGESGEANFCFGVLLSPEFLQEVNDYKPIEPIVATTTGC
jgi:hypothetical protein